MNLLAGERTRVRGTRRPIVRGAGELFFALFLFAGYYKADPRLAFIQSRIDITVLFLVLSLLVLLYRMIQNGFTQRIRRDFAQTAVLFLLLAACLLGGLLYTQSRDYGFEKALRFVILTGWAFFDAGLLISDFLSLRRFSWALVAISTIMAIDALLGYPGAGQVGFVTAFGSNYIALARASGLGLLATVGFLLPTERRSSVRLYLWVMAALQLWAALSAGARGPVLALILSFLLFFVLSVRGLPQLRVNRFALRLGVVAFFVIVVLAMVGQEVFPTLALRSRILMTGGGSSVAERLDLYRAAVELWTKSPIWGNGTGQFAMAVTGQDIRLYPHNIILELGAETGLIGVLVFVTMIGVAFTKGFVGLHSEKGFARTVARYLLVAGCFALVNAMVSGDINDNRILFALAGLLAATRHFQGGVVARGDVLGCAAELSKSMRLSDTKERQR